jgi:hypothetical protein
MGVVHGGCRRHSLLKNRDSVTPSEVGTVLDDEEQA